MMEGLEHDTAEESAARGWKAMRAPTRDKAVHSPPQSKAKERRQDLRERRGIADRPWLHPENPDIWDGDDDSE